MGHLLLQLSSNRLVKRGPRSLKGTPRWRRSEEVARAKENCKVRGPWEEREPARNLGGEEGARCALSAGEWVTETGEVTLRKKRVWSGGDGDGGDLGPPGGLEEDGELVLKQR